MVAAGEGKGRRRVGATVGESGGVRDLGWPKKWIRMEDSMIVGDGAEEGEGESITGGRGISAKIRGTANGRAGMEKGVKNAAVSPVDFFNL